MLGRKLAGVTTGLAFLLPGTLLPAASTPSPVKQGVVRAVPAWDNDIPIIDGPTISFSSDPTIKTLATRTNSAAGPSGLGAAAPPFLCHVYAGDVYFRSGPPPTIEGWGYQSCTGSGWAPQNIQITIQRYKGYGFWQNVLQDQTGYTYNAYDSMTKYYSCQGTGDWDYRTVIDAWVSGGAQVAHGQSRLYYEVIC